MIHEPPQAPPPGSGARRSPSAQDLIAERLKRRSGSPASRQGIPRRAGPDPAPASFAQERLWFLAQLIPENPTYNITRAFALRGPLDPVALERSFREIVRRHEALRTVFEAAGPVLAQRPGPVPALLLPVVDLAGLPAGVRQAEEERLRHAEARRPFDLERGPLLRLALLRLGAAEHALLLTLHHIAADGWSIDVLFRELSELYRVISEGRPALLPDLPVQYADFAVWQRERLQGEILERLLAYWRRQLAGAPPVLEIPSDRPRPAVRTWAGDLRTFDLAVPAEVLGQAAGARGASPFMVLLAAFFALLQRTAGRADLIVGSPVAGRDRREVEGLIGLFVNTLVLRADLSGDPTFEEVLRRTREATLGAYDHQEMPFDKLVEALAPERGLSSTPLFQVLFSLENVGHTPFRLPGLDAAPRVAWSGAVKLDLSVTLRESGNGLSVSLVYDREIFDATAMARLAAHYETLLAGAIAEPGRRLSGLPLLTAAERQQLLREWNDTRSDAPLERTVHELFAEQARLRPAAIAVSEDGESLTFAELNARANRLAHHLRALGVGPDVAVGVCLNRSAEAVTALLGILKAGGAYVPLDPAYPRERLAFMLDDTAAPLVLTVSRHLSSLPELGGRNVVVLDRDLDLDREGNAADPGSGAGLDHLAYVIYTSGSTGRPKGVAVPHRAVARLVRRPRFAELAAGETWLQFAPVAFDASTLEIWGSLANGGRLVVFPSYTPSLQELGDAIEREGVTSLWLTAGLFHQMVEGPIESLRGVRQLLAGGDVLSVPHVEKVLARLPELTLINGYGPTENTTFTCCHRPHRSRPLAGPVPIGRPIDATRVLLLDGHLQPVPIGSVGELYAGGEGLARGYLNRPELTAERFVPDPTPQGTREPGARLYRTGDLARHLPDGTIEFLGRIDHQVKIRGFRIELGEVEAALCAHPRVRAAVALAREDVPGDKTLVAYVVAEDGALPPDLRSFLRERLPEPMVPAAFVSLESLPLDPNGKVDRKALPAPVVSGGVEQQDRTAPRSPVEELLAGIWAEVLRIEPPGIDESFFDLGGHSLLAMRVVARVREVCAVELPLRALFEGPTVAQLAEAVEAARRGGKALQIPPIGTLEDREEAPASFAQERLWFLARMEPESPFYNIPAVLRLSGQLDIQALARSLHEIRRRHAVLRAAFAVSLAGPVQKVLPLPPAALPILDLSGLAPDVCHAEAARLAAEEARRPFDLEAGSLLRLALVALSPREHRLFLTLHHIVADGWSMGILARELSALYGAFSRGALSPLSPLPVQYGDVAAWQRGWLCGEILAEQLAVWRQRLAGAPALLELPTDRPRPPVMRFRGSHAPAALDPRLSGALAALGRQRGATLFMTLAAGFAALLSRGSGLFDLPVGTVVAGRTRPEQEGLIGLFVNTLVLRADLAGDPGFAEILTRVRRVTIDAFAHQDVPFEKLVQELQPERSLAHSPLFQVMVMLINIPEARFDLPGLTIALEPPESGTVKFDLNLALAEGEKGLTGALAYNSDLFDKTTAARMIRHLETLLAGAVEEPDRRLSELPFLTLAERHQTLHEWNDTSEELAAGPTLSDLFFAQAERTPEAPAVLCGGETLTYRELARRSRRLARHLRSLGVRPGVLVAVHLQRGPGMIVALLGALEAGGAYVPLSTSFPEERIRLILSSLEISHLVTEEPRPGGLAVDVEHTVLLPLDSKDLEDSKVANDTEASGAPPGPGDLAYIIFTSGSTGTPKGVMIRHAPAVNLVAWANRTFGIGPSDRVLFITSLSFDLSVYDVFGLLAAGGSIRIASSEEVRDPGLLARILSEEPVTFWDSAPAALLQLTPFLPAAPVGSARLRLVFLSGDWIPVGLPGRVRQAFPGAEVVSLGGATEATIWSNVHRIGEVPPHWTSIPYGRPIANAHYHVLDQDLNLCPAGVPGDLYIGGACLSTGYARDPVLTAGKYIPSPCGEEPGERLYRTGDRARCWADGTLEFLGRVDTQVKVRGFRIELGEIETALAGYPGVREAVVLVRNESAGDQRLVACVRPAEEPAPMLAEVRRFLGTRLPDYMLPSDLVLCEAWPVTPTGKLDRRALLERSRPARRNAAPDPAPAGEPPRTELERAIAAVWCQVIGREEVGVRDNFFDLGGHSLLIVEIQTRLREAVGRDVAIVDLFRYSTVAALAEHLEGTAPAPRPAAVPAREQAAGSAVAIVGMAGRFPGASDLEELWRNLCEGVESITFFSWEELAAAGIDPALLADPAYVPARGVLPGADLFDAAFFDCPPREAEILDPQQRVFLECAWEALEAAGYVPETTPGRVGVYAGLSENSYVQGLHADTALVRSVGLFQLSLANKPEYLPTRLSYKLDLKGPSVNVQTACSTSLVAVHMACRALLAGECEMALAGGVSIRCPQVAGYRWEEGSIASPDGHVRAFDAAAGGTVAGSGAGVVVLKRLEDALADRDTIRAVILGSGVNNDGSAKVGFTAPSVEGQAEVVRQALQAAGVEPGTIRYIETHGTGTAMGDPIEVAGLTQAFQDAACEQGTVALGSLKTNLGHLDAAAGIAGLLKTVLCLERRAIPPSLHFTAPNPRIDFAGSPFYVNAALADWPGDDAPRRAGVSSFGIGGTNAHAVLQEAPSPEPAAPSRPAQLLTLSARTFPALAAAAARLADHLESHPELDLADVAYTLQMGRRQLRHRQMLVSASREEAIRRLRDGRAEASLGEIANAARPVAFLFPGQGAQRAGMGSGLYAAEPAFREALDQASEILTPEIGIDLRLLLGKAAEGWADADRRLEDTAFAQPALFAVEYALARLLMEWGIRPHAMLGHSLGEYVAACLAGVFTLEEGARLVAARGRLMGELPPGRMVAVSMPEDEARAWLEDNRLEDHPDLALAAVNGPRDATLSGPPEAVARIVERLERHGIEHRLLRTSHAFHSPMMEPVLERFAAEMRRIDLRPPTLPYLSNLTGTWITAAEATDPGYWVRHMVSTVRFGDSLGTLLAAEGSILLEVGPGRALSTLVRRHPMGWARPVLAALGPARDGAAEPAALLAALGKLWVAGGAMDVTGFWARESRRRIPLPTYPFERRSYWRDGRRTQEGSAAPPRVETRGYEWPSRWDGEARDRNDHALCPEGTAIHSPGFQPGVGTEIERGVAAVFEELLGVSGVRPQDDFFDLGGSSLMALRLSARLRETLGADLPASALLEASTVEALAERIAAAGGDRPSTEAARPSCLIRLRAGESGRPLFLVHQVGGHVYSFRALTRALAPGQPIYGLRSRGLEAGEEPLTSVEEMADHYLALIREVQPRGPYLLGGASMGGSVALEMAQRLRAAGEDVPLLTLMDAPSRDVLPERPRDEVTLAQVMPSAPRLTPEEVRGLALEEQLARAIEKAEAAGGLPAGFDAAEAERLLRVMHANIAALFAYELPTYDGPILFFRARERRPGDPLRPEEPWVDRAAGGIEIHVVPGDHATMHEPPNVQVMAARLERRLR